jgi:hypothetical protein
LSDDIPHVPGGAQGEALENLKDRKASHKLNAPGWGRCFEIQEKLIYSNKQPACVVTQNL